MYRVAGNKRPDPRQDFITDHIPFIREQSCIACTIAVGILIVANETLSSEAEGLIQRLTHTLNLTDIHDNIMIGPDGPATYLRGKEQIDYGLFPPEFLPSIRPCGFRTFQDGPTRQLADMLGGISPLSTTLPYATSKVIHPRR